MLVKDTCNLGNVPMGGAEVRSDVFATSGYLHARPGRIDCEIFVGQTKQMISIRRARGDDIPTILRVEKKSFSRDAWDREAFADYLSQPSKSVFLVATINGEIVGYALAFHGKTGAEIDSIAVTPARRGQGVAVALLNRLIKTLKRRGFGTISLNVRLENEAAIRLYRKLGFRRVRRINHYYEDGAPTWRMRKAG